MTFLDRQFIDADDLRGWLWGLGQPVLHGLDIQILDRVLVQVQQFGHGLIRHIPTQEADLLGEPLRVTRILRQPVEPLHLSTFTP